MNEPLRIGILYSYGPHFVKAVREMRARYPNSHITVLIPPSFPVSAVEAFVDDVEVCAPEPGRSRSLAQFNVLLKSLRRTRYDMLVLLFSSFRLQIIAALSAATSRYCYGLDGTLSKIRLNFARTLLSGFWHAFRGRIRYAYIWWQIYYYPVTTQIPDDTDHQTPPRDE